MAEIIIMPKLGFNMSTGKLVRWYKQEGDPVKKGEPIFAIETDKTSIDIEATQEGVFRKKFIEEGDSVEVTLPIAIVADAAENIDVAIQEVNSKLGRTSEAGNTDISADRSGKEMENRNAAEAAQSGAPMAKVQHTECGILKITPRARRFAKEKGLELERIQLAGTGYDGGICEKDILSYLESHKMKATPVAQKIAESRGIALEDIQGTGINGKITKEDLLGSLRDDKAVGTQMQQSGGFAPSQGAEGPFTSEGPFASEVQVTPDGKEILEVVPYSGVRKIIGDRLSQSKFTAPHLYFTQKVNLEKLLDLRKEVNEAQSKKTSVTDYIAKAVIITLQKYPEMNASLAGDKIEKYKSVNLGIAVAAPTGLIVPVVKHSENKSVLEISKESSALFEKARNGKLSPDEYSGGTFTISNLGMFGIENFTAIINPPEVGILAISATKDEPWVETDEKGEKKLTIKPMMNITLSVDHRIIDGLLAAQFVTEVKRLLEHPIELML